MRKAGSRANTITLDLRSAGGGLCPCAVRVSERARRVRLTVDATGLTAVVPAGFSIDRLAPILDSRKGWIVEALGKIARLELGEGTFPATLELRALDEVWRVTSDGDPQTRLKAQVRDHAPRPARVLSLAADFNRSEALVALRRWVLLRGKEALPPWLGEVAAEFAFSPARVTVKPLKSRWGSCSALGNVNLSAWLLFLPPRLVRHVLLHELCHLRELNHSQAFHNHLRNLDPEAERHSRELRDAWTFVPAWVRG